MRRPIEAVTKILIYFPFLMIFPVTVFGIRLDFFWQIAVVIFCVLEIILKLKAERVIFIAAIFILINALLTLPYRNWMFSDLGFVSGILALPLIIYLLKRISLENFNLNVVRIQFAFFLIACALIMFFQSLGSDFTEFYGLNNKDVYTLIISGGRFIGPFGLPTEASAIGLLAMAAGFSISNWYFKLIYVGAGFVICWLASSKIFIFGIFFLFLWYLYRYLEKTAFIIAIIMMTPLLIYLVVGAGNTRFNLVDGKIVRGISNFSGDLIVGAGFFGLDRSTDSILLAAVLGSGILGIVLFVISIIMFGRELLARFNKDARFFYLGSILFSFLITLPGTFILWTERVCYVLLVVIICLSGSARSKRVL